MERYSLKLLSLRQTNKLSSIIVVFMLVFSSLVILTPKTARADTIEWTQEDLQILTDITIGQSDVVIARGPLTIMSGATLTVDGTLICKRNPDQLMDPAGISIMSGTLDIDGRGDEREGHVYIETATENPEQSATIVLSQGSSFILREGKVNRTDDDLDKFFNITMDGEGNSFKTIGASPNDNVFDGLWGFQVNGPGYTLENLTIQDFGEIAVSVGGQNFLPGSELIIKNLNIEDTSAPNQLGMFFEQFPPIMVDYELSDIEIDSDIGLSFLQGSPVMEKITIEGADTGIIADQMSSPVFEEIEIEEPNYGVICSQSSNPIFIDSKITEYGREGLNSSGSSMPIFFESELSDSGSTTYDIVIQGDSRVRFYDSLINDNDMDNINVNWVDVMELSGKVEFGTLINVGVTNQHGEPVEGASVSVQGTFLDRQGQIDPELSEIFPSFPGMMEPSPYFTPVTDDNGEYYDVPVILNDTHKDDEGEDETQEYDPHRVIAKYLDTTNYTEMADPVITVTTDWVNVTLNQSADMYVDSDNITLSKAMPTAGVNEPPLLVNATIFNFGNSSTELLSECTVNFYYNTTNETGDNYTKFIGSDTIIVNGTQSAVASVQWDTTRNMSGSGNPFMNGTHTIIVEIEPALDEDALGDDFVLDNNNASRDFKLYMPRPELEITEVSSDITMLVDGDIPQLGINLTNKGFSTVGDVNIQIQMAKVGTNVEWNTTTMSYTNVTNLSDIKFSETDTSNTNTTNPYLYSVYENLFDANLSYTTMADYLWDTSDLANDSLTPDLDEKYWDYVLYFVVTYNDTINSTDIGGDNLSYSFFQQSFSIYKYYEVDGELDNDISFVNSNKPETSFPVTVFNKGRAFDNLTVEVTKEGSNESNLDNWHYSFWLFDGNDWTMFDEFTEVLGLIGGNDLVLYANVSGTLDEGEIIGDPGEFVYVNFTIHSTGNNTSNVSFSLLVVNGRPDLTPVRVRFYREDGMEVSRTGENEQDKKSLLINETSTIRVFIQNLGNATVYLPFWIRVYDNTSKLWIGNVTHTAEILRFQVSWVDIEYTFIMNDSDSVHEFLVYVDIPNDSINESNENNNEMDASIYIKNDNATDEYCVKGTALSWDSVTKVEGAQVTVRNIRTNVTYTNDTDINGYFTIIVPRDDYKERDTFTVEIKVTNLSSEHYPLRDMYTITAVYSEDNSTFHDFVLLADGVDLAIYTRYEHAISIYRQDGKRTNEPIADDEVTIEFFVANRGRNSTIATYTIEIDGILREKVSFKSFSTSARLTRITFTHTFTEIAVDHNISVMIGSAEDGYLWNNASLRESIAVKGSQTDANYLISGIIYESGAVDPAIFADVVITNIRTSQNMSFQADKNGKFTDKDLQSMTDDYREGDEIEIKADGENGGGNLTFFAYSEDGGKNITLIFARFDVSLVIVDNQKTVKPGDMASYSLEITNFGNREDTIRLALESDTGHNGWATLSITSVTLKAGEKKKATLQVAVPGGELADVVAEITVRAVTNYGNGPDDVKSSYTTVDNVYDLDITLVGGNQSHGKPGETVEYEIEITNNGNGEDFVVLGVDSQLDWDVSFSENAFLLENPGDSANITVFVEVGKDAADQDVVVFMVRARSSGATFFTSDFFFTTTTDPLVDLDISRETADKSAVPEEEISYRLILTNTGNTDGQEYDLAIKRSADRSSVGTESSIVAFSSGSSQFSDTITVTLDKDGTRSLTVYVTPVDNAPADSLLVVELTVTSPAIEGQDTVYLTTSVKLDLSEGNEPSISRRGAKDQSILPGKTVRFNFDVINNINDVDTISFDVTMTTTMASEEDFEYIMNPVTLSGGDTTTAVLIVRASANVYFGSRADFTVTAVSTLDNTLKNSSAAAVEVTDLIYGFNVEKSTISMVVPQGESNKMTFTIHRSSADTMIEGYQAVYLVSVEHTTANLDWSFSYPDTVIFPKNVKNKTVTLDISIPAGSSISNEETVTVTVTSLENPDLPADLFDLNVKMNKPPASANIQVEDAAGNLLDLATQRVFYNTEYTFTSSPGSDNDAVQERLEFIWSWGDLSTDSGEELKHFYVRPDQYTIILTIRELSADENSTEVYGETSYSFLFIADNADPVFSARVETAGDSYTKGSTIDFTVVDPVIDEEPTKVSYTWNFGDGTIRNSESKTISHSYVRSGIYKVNVRGEDNYGRFSSYEFDVEVINQKPVPSFVILGKEDGFKEGDEVSFDAKASQDPDDFIVSYVWDFGDGTNGTGVAPSHIFKTIGTHNVILTVYDQEGASDVFSDSIVIEEEDENIDVDYLSFAAALFGVIILFLIILTFGPKLAAQTKTIDVKEMGKTMKKELDDLFADAKVDLDQLIQEEARRQPMVAPVPIPVSGGEAAPVVAAPAAPAFNTSFCTSCGTSLEAGARFCTECGTSS